MQVVRRGFEACPPAGRPEAYYRGRQPCIRISIMRRRTAFGPPPPRLFFVFSEASTASIVALSPPVGLDGQAGDVASLTIRCATDEPRTVGRTAGRVAFHRIFVSPMSEDATLE